MNASQFHSSRRFTPARRGRIAPVIRGPEPVALSRVTLCSMAFSGAPRLRIGARDLRFQTIFMYRRPPLDMRSLSTHHDGLPMRRQGLAPWQGAAGDGFFGEIPLDVPLAGSGAGICLGRARSIQGALT